MKRLGDWRVATGACWLLGLVVAFGLALALRWH